MSAPREPVQNILSFGTGRTFALNSSVSINMPYDTAKRLLFKVIEQVDFGLTLYLDDANGNRIFMMGGLATDSLAELSAFTLILEGTTYKPSQMAIKSTGTCTVVIAAEF